MGKTSLLTMLKLTHLLSFWPQDLDFVLLKLGDDTLDQISRIKNKRKTVASRFVRRGSSCLGKNRAAIA